MKDQDSTNNALCYCKESRPVKRFPVKEESKEAIRDTITSTMNSDKSKPWSVFGEWYWI